MFGTVQKGSDSVMNDDRLTNLQFVMTLIGIHEAMHIDHL